MEPVPATTYRSPSGNPLEVDFARLTGQQQLLATLSCVVFYLVLNLLGYFLKEHLDSLTIIWPAAGLLLVVLWWLPFRQWVAVFFVQAVLEQVAALWVPKTHVH